MKIRVALQGRMREFTLQAFGAYAEHALEPPSWHRPTGTNYGRFVVRRYRYVRYDEQTDTMTGVGSAEYWL